MELCVNVNKKFPPAKIAGGKPVFRAVMVEPRGIEPLSENPSSQLSPSAVYHLDLPRTSADKQALAFGSL